MELYTFYLSSAAYRVRIALHYKGLEFRSIPVGLATGTGEQNEPEYRTTNPQGMVPTLVHGELVLSQSSAIIEYLEEAFPEPPLLPQRWEHRARARQFAQIIACDIHPLNNLRVRQYLKVRCGLDDKQRRTWYQHWIMDGFDALELWLTASEFSGPYCLGSAVTIADVFLVPQLYNARRNRIPLSDFPTLCEIEKNCNALQAFRLAAPEAQPDAVSAA